ncbi:cupin domain-containing protein [Streptacidiphilus rugosus]|uniref:cupin domain-containing protein n=1 Tax=Streptacidiphilus rugosus TaxID=405783 RepID=UPI000569C9E4|nr:cupin domain-containing protein [Streptacidiphilus rugosus]
MEIFRFERAERLMTRHGSIGLHATRVAAGEGRLQVTCLTVEPGGIIGTHPATSAQMFLVVTGGGWVAGQDGNRFPISAGQGARWEAGEEHTTGTDTGLTALVLEGPLDLFEPEASSGTAER